MRGSYRRRLRRQRGRAFDLALLFLFGVRRGFGMVCWEGRFAGHREWRVKKGLAFVRSMGALWDVRMRSGDGQL
jgi:hypothetical protein